MLGMILLLVLMLSMTGGPASAAYDSYKPALTVTSTGAYWGSYADYLARNLTVSYSLANGPSQMAEDVHISGASASNGVSLLTSLPLNIGHLMNDESTSFLLNFNVPMGVGSFRTNISGDAMDEAGNKYNYPEESNLMNRIYSTNTGGTTGAPVVPSIDVIDADTLKVVERFQDFSLIGAAQSHNLVVSPDGQYIWNSEQPGATSTGFVQLIDASNGAQLNRWDVGSANGPHLNASWTRGGHHFVFITGNKPGMTGINVFDVESQSYVGLIPEAVASTGHIMDTTNDGTTLWHTVGSNVVRYDITGLPGTLPTAPTAVIPVGGSLHALVVTHDGRYVIAGSSTLGGVNIIDTGTNTIVATKRGGVGTAHNFTISPDGDTLLMGETGAYSCSGEVDPLLPHDGSVGPFAWYLDISTLKTASPDFASIVVTDRLDSRSVGPASAVSHHVWTPDSTKILLTTYGVAGGIYGTLGEGQLLTLDADTHALDDLQNISRRTHGLAYPGYAR